VKGSACRGRAAAHWCLQTAGRLACSPSCSSEGRPDEVAAQSRRLADGQSILDSVGDQAKKLKGDLGVNDREKLDEYFTSVRELEQRLAKNEEWSKKPKPKVTAKQPQNNMNPGDLIGRTRLLFDLTHLAFQTDSTRSSRSYSAGPAPCRRSPA